MVPEPEPPPPELGVDGWGVVVVDEELPPEPPRVWEPPLDLWPDFPEPPEPLPTLPEPSEEPLPPEPASSSEVTLAVDGPGVEVVVVVVVVVVSCVGGSVLGAGVLGSLAGSLAPGD